MSDQKHVLVLIKSDTCHHCTALEKIWPEVQAGLSGLNLKEFTVKLSKYNQDPFKGGPEAIKSRCYSSWFPFIMLVPASSWNAAMADKSMRSFKDAFVLNGVVNAELDASSSEKIKPEPVLDTRKSQNIIEWVRKVLAIISSSREASTDSRNLARETTSDGRNGPPSVCSSMKMRVVSRNKSH